MGSEAPSSCSAAHPKKENEASGGRSKPWRRRRLLPVGVLMAATCLLLMLSKQVRRAAFTHTIHSANLRFLPRSPHFLVSPTVVGFPAVNPTTRNPNPTPSTSKPSSAAPPLHTVQSANFRFLSRFARLIGALWAVRGRVAGVWRLRRRKKTIIRSSGCCRTPRRSRLRKRTTRWTPPSSFSV